MDKLRLARKWLKGKLRGRLEKAPKESKLVIGHPTDFRRENITLGTDVDGNAVLVEQAREDAQAMHVASKTRTTDNTTG
ncbi:hypothetical protein Z517_04970 [Fonsecaea pedrosoi CBS 271.37]|uniref:Uncharacterized protein n=1 Tax=Fonsecaea pedrosoi CBS 271.37 TaxID=1442368 RepID=A0A0D2HBN8_9EURO|nr:uncharacterized protein Z517_04970 [Fonsecaea pedrosoi CBS 271.37]KIW81944.1 hypothetical protein Z517_04970 [Fonsecaea pedrosoi CBS 271.37]